MVRKKRDYTEARPDRKRTVPFDERSASRDTPIPNVHGALLQAIENKNFVTLSMHGHEVSGEPHVYGMRGGRPMVLIYNEETDPQWQLADVRHVERVKIWIDEHFEKRELPAEYDPDKGGEQP